MPATVLTRCRQTKPEQIQRKAVRQMVLDLRDICKSYMQGKEPVPVLHHIQLQVEEGEYLAIMGPVRENPR